MEWDGELAAVRGAIERRDGREALTRSLAIWEETRGVEIAELIDLVSAALTRTLSPIEGKTRANLHAAWLDVAGRRDPVDVGRLMAALLADPCTLVRERILAMTTWRPDPRVARALTAMVIAAPCTSAPNAPMWTSVWAQLTALADARAVAPFQTIRARGGDPTAFGSLHVQRVNQYLDKVAPPAPLTGPLAEQIDALTRLVTGLEGVVVGPPPAKTGAKEATEADLFALVWDQPDDDAPREVLADWLIERGDTRGELIRLQLARQHASAGTRALTRERALLRQHGRQWLGPLEPVILGARAGSGFGQPTTFGFARGFVDTCTVRFRTELQRRELAAHPAWATVQTLFGAPELFDRAPLKSLRFALEQPYARVLEVLERPGPSVPIRTLELLMRDIPAAAQRALADAGRVPELRELRISAWSPAGAVAWLLEGPLVAQLERIFTGMSQAHYLAAWLERFAAFERTPKLLFHVLGCREPLTLERDRGATRARLACTDEELELCRGSLATALSGTRGLIASLHVVTTDVRPTELTKEKFFRALSDHDRRLEVELEHRPAQTT